MTRTICCVRARSAGGLLHGSGIPASKARDCIPERELGVAERVPPMLVRAHQDSDADTPKEPPAGGTLLAAASFIGESCMPFNPDRIRRHSRVRVRPYLAQPCFPAPMMRLTT